MVQVLQVMLFEKLVDRRPIQPKLPGQIGITPFRIESLGP
jgi:hypothetical protein